MERETVLATVPAGAEKGADYAGEWEGNMNNEEIQIAVAKLCGKWTPEIEKNYNYAFKLGHVPGSNWKRSRALVTLPSYPTSLDACSEFEKSLTHDEWIFYIGFINGVTTIQHLMSMEQFHSCWNSEPVTRCIAFLKLRGQHVHP